MKKYFFAVLLSAFCIQAFSQINEAFKIDSVKLISLKKMLPLLKDSARVDMLNSIAIKTTFNAAGSPRVRIDSCLSYASKAYKEAVNLGYKSGTAMAILLLNGIESVMNQPVTDELTKEKNIRAAIRLGEESNDNIVLGYGYYYLPVKNDFKKHVESWKKSIQYFLKAADTLHAAEVTNWLCSDYIVRGEYEQAFDYGKK